MKWHTCNSCEAEFRVVSDELDEVQFCPFCSEEILPDVEEDEEEVDWDAEDFDDKF